MTRLKVMNWNVLYSEKADNILRVIREIQPDILCCQEITTDSFINPGRDVPAEINKIIGGQYSYLEVLPLIQGKPGSMGNAIFSRFPITYERHQLIQRGGYDIENKLQNRGYMEIKTKIDDLILTIGTTHLSYVDGFIETKPRSEEAERLIGLISPNKEKYIIAGDFNSAPDSTTIRKIEGLLSSAGPDHRRLTFSTKPFKNGDFRVDGLEWRLDYIFVTSDIKVVSSEIMSTDVSDHLPIVTQVELE